MSIVDLDQRILSEQYNFHTVRESSDELSADFDKLHDIICWLKINVGKKGIDWEVDSMLGSVDLNKILVNYRYFFYFMQSEDLMLFELRYPGDRL